MPHLGFSDLYFWMGVTLLVLLVLTYVGFDVYKLVALIRQWRESTRPREEDEEPVPRLAFPKGRTIRIAVILLLLICGIIVLRAAQRGRASALREYGSYVQKEIEKAPPKSIEQVNAETQEKLAKEAETDREKIQKTSDKQTEDVGKTMSTFRKTIMERDKDKDKDKEGVQ